MDEISIKDFTDMFMSYKEAQLAERWEKAYWTACAMSVHTKHSVDPSKLMGPFLPEKSLAEKADEKEAFFKQFNKQRKEGNQ